MVKLEKVNKFFNHRKRNEIHIISNTSLELGDCGLVAILGQSGSGKTTLLNVIGGLDKVNKGKIFINGKKITRKSAGRVDKIRNLNIGYIFQDYKLIDNMSVFDNVALSLRMIGLKNKKEIAKRVNYVLEAVNMYRYRNKPSQMLSGGEKQRVAIARAIVKNPSIVIADEPTGNLDSKNSLEIMNILKAISKEKLVILVTHEVELAQFYATRIIEIQDGAVVKDYANQTKESLEYRLDNKIYLKDFKNVNSIKGKNVNVDIYSDDEKNSVNVKLVIKNGNIFIKADTSKVDVVDDNSALEIVDAHYKKIDKSVYEEYKYDIDNIIDKKYKVKYSSVYGIFKSLKYGFKRILNYTVLKKFLLFGFFASSMFIVYSVCDISAALDVKESDYMQIDKNYLQVDTANVNVDDYLKYENLENIDYIIPGDGSVSFGLKMDTYYQLAKYSYSLDGSLVDINKINKNDIIKGRMPENSYEIVLDKKVFSKLLDEPFSPIKAMGIKDEDELLDKKVTINDMKDFIIAGFVDKSSESIYVDKALFINILNNKNGFNMESGMYMNTDNKLELPTESDYANTSNDSNVAMVKDYNLYLDDIKLTKGRMPTNDYEVIVNSVNQYEMKLDKQIKNTVNGQKLKVVGFYESKTNRQDYLVNNNTVKYSVIKRNNGFMIYPKEDKKMFTKSQFQNEYGLNVIDRYEKDKAQYMKSNKERVKSTIIFATVMLAISLIEIYLMMRSSFLSRIKEVGILRAIGIKKLDIYRMFLGEIISISTIASLPGIILMTYILSQIIKVSYLARTFIVNISTIGLSVIIVYAFNILVGLLPLFKVLRNTPAKILARYDVD